MRQSPSPLPSESRILCNLRQYPCIWLEEMTNTERFLWRIASVSAEIGMGSRKREALPQDCKIPEIPTAPAGMFQAFVTKGVSWRAAPGHRLSPFRNGVSSLWRMRQDVYSISSQCNCRFPIECVACRTRKMGTCDIACPPMRVSLSLWFFKTKQIRKCMHGLYILYLSVLGSLFLCSYQTLLGCASQWEWGGQRGVSNAFKIFDRKKLRNKMSRKTST